MLGALGLSLALLAGQAPPTANPVTAPEGWNVVGQTTIMGRTVPIAFPPTPGPFGPDTPHFAWGGAKYAVAPDGTITGRYLEDGGWADAAAMFRAAATADGIRTTYPMKVVLVTRCEMIERGRDGVYRVRRGVIERFQVDQILLALAQAKGLAEAATAGRIDVTFRVTADNDLTVQELGPDGGTAAGPFRQAFLLDTVAARINDDAFDSDDGVYRGPYAGVIVVHAGLTADVETTLIGDTPVTTVPFYGFSDRSALDALGIQFFEVWRHQLALNASRYGALVGDLTPVPSGASLPNVPGVADRMPTPVEVARGNRAALSRDEARPWTPARPAQAPGYAESDAAQDPLGRVGSAGDVTAELKGVAIQEVERDGRRWWFVRPDMAAMVTALVGGSRAVGVAVDPAPGAVRRAVVFDMTGRPGDAMWQRLAPAEAPVFPPRLVGPPEQIPDPLVPRVGAVGDYEAVAVADDPQGSVWRVTLSGLTPRGYVTLATKPGGTLFNGWRDPVLSLKARTSSTEPFAVSFVGPDGLVIGSALFGGTMAVPADVNGEPPVVRSAPVPADGGWHDVQIRVRELVGDAPVREVRLGPVPFAQFYERRSLGPASIDVTMPTLSEAPEGMPALAPVAPDPRLAELQAMSGALDDNGWARLQELLSAEDLTVRLNAVAALARVTRPEALAVLGAQTRSGDNMTAYLASRLVGVENTPERLAILAETVQRGPFDTNRRFAAEVMGLWKDAPSSTSLAALLAAESWRTRAAGARALAGVPSREAGILQISFLQDVEPQVRLAVTQGADTALELAGRRLIFGAVNDPSEAVRAASLVRLLEGADSAFQREAYRTLRDESLSVRLAMVQALGARNNAAARVALRAAVVDVSPIIRAAALEALALQEEPVQVAEIQNTLSDTDPRVQRALLELAVKQGLTLPAATVRAMRASLDPELAARAANLPEGP